MTRKPSRAKGGPPGGSAKIALAERLCREAMIAQQSGQTDQAIALLGQSILANPKSAESHDALAVLLRGQGRGEELLACCRRAAEALPDHLGAQVNLAVVAWEQGLAEESIAFYRRALRLKPDYAEAHANLGVVFKELRRFDEAIACFRQAIAAQPDHSMAHNHLAVVLHELGRQDEAIACFRRAIELAPDNAAAHTNLAATLLQRGEFEPGWREFAWRFRYVAAAVRPFPQPRWSGEDLRGRTLLVWGEQGIGDETVFFALLPELREMGARLVVECDARLVAPLRRSLPWAEVVARHEPPDPRCLQGDIDFQIAAGDVAARLRPSRADFRPLVPYLRPDPSLVAELRQRYLADGGGLLVGLSWWSRATTASKRSFDLAQWLPILTVPGTRFVSVQYGDRRAEIEALRRDCGIEVLLDDSVDPLVDLDRALAQIAAMDRIVTIDNSTVHFTAMLGGKAILLTPFVPSWFCGLAAEQSPWIPGVRLIRPSALDDWAPVIAAVADDLRHAVQISALSPPEAFAEALRRHQDGDLVGAERLYRHVLASAPHHADSLHLLGAIAQQSGRFALAIDLIGQAIALNPQPALYHCNLGLALKDGGLPDRAIEAYRQSIARDPGQVEAHLGLGLALKALGRVDEAIAAYGAAIDRSPDYAEAHNNLGLALKDQGRLDEAEASTRRAAALRPDSAEILNNLGDILHARKLWDQAIALYRQAIALKGDYAEAHHNLGMALKEAGRYGEAEASSRRAIELKPDYPDAHNNLGLILHETRRSDQAIACFRRAIELRPDHPGTHVNLSLALLMVGQYPEGWREHEWRFRSGPPARPFPQPLWNGESLDGRTLLVWGEQGVGDEISFFAFLPELLEQGARLVVECERRLVPMLRRALPGIEVVARQPSPDPRLLADDIDFQLACGTLCGRCRPSWPDFRPVAPYLVPDPAVVTELRRRYGGDQGIPLVGLSWTSQRKGIDRHTFALSQWRPILTVPGVRFVSVQYGDHRDEIEAVSRELGVPIVIDDSVDPLSDLDRASAQIAAMDLVVTMSNSAQPLAANTGTPAFALTLGHERTEQDGDVSPWEPSVRMFRQQPLGDWSSAIEDVAEALRQWSGQGEAVPDRPQEPQTLQQALAHHQAGRLEEAERIYQSILRVDSAEADARHLLGVIQYQTGRCEQAVETIGKAVAAAPANPAIHSNLGLALKSLGRLDQAIASFRRAIALDPNFDEAQVNLALTLLAQERLPEAVAAFRAALTINPRHPDAFYNLGLTLASLGQTDQALACYHNAIQLRPDFAEAYNNLGLLLKDQDHIDQAIACCQRAVALIPGRADFHNNLALTLQKAGKLEEAVAAFCRAFDLAPGSARTLANLGGALRQMGRLDDSIACCRRALEAQADSQDATFNLGLALSDQGHFDEAIGCFASVIDRQPDHFEAQTCLSAALKGVGRLEDAIASCRTALEIKPDHAETISHLGALMWELGRLDEAEAHCRRALEISPDSVGAHINLGVTLRDLGQRQAAIAQFRTAIRLQPDNAEAHTNLALALVRGGDFAEGWREYEWRLLQKGFSPRPFPQPLWNGESLDGRTLLVWGEQGVGDEISFFAFLPELLEQGARLVVECERRLVPMLRRALPGIEVVARQPSPDPRLLADDIDFQLACGTLCGRCRPSWPDFRPVAPYLVPDPAVVTELRRRYGGDQGIPLVGLSWTSQRKGIDRHTFALSQWRPILTVPGVRFVSVQYGDHRDEIEAVSRELGVPIVIDDSVDPLSDLDRASAQIAAMDLVVTMSNTAQPLAAMTGTPAFALILYNERTEQDGDVSPWEPAVRMFRQQPRGDWSSAIERVATALRSWAVAGEYINKQ